MGIIQIRDPIHGFIELSEDEKRIIDTKPFQRLRYIRQLALTYLIYPGANHTRFEHSIGVMHLVSDAFDSALNNTRDDVFYLSEGKRAIYRQILRLIALTHDLGHAPFSHASEEVFHENMTHEDYTRKIVCETEIGEIITEIGEKYKTKYGNEPVITPKLVCDIYDGLNPGPNSEYTFLKSFMDSELDCDKMDYLLRDSYYCGVKYGNYDKTRLIESFTIFSPNSIPRLAIRKGGVQAFEEFVLARYFMFVQVYFHKTRRYFDKKFVEALKEVLPDGEYPVSVRDYLEWDDSRILLLLKEKRDSSEPCRCIMDRIIYKCVFETKIHPVSADIRDYNQVYKELKGKYSVGQIFKDDNAGKLPHKIPRRTEVSEENAIIIYDAETNRIRTISEESEIIKALTEKIDIRRIYCRPDIADEALKLVRQHNDLQEDL